MEHTFMKKRLQRHLEAVITEAMSAIEIISKAGLEEMNDRGIKINEICELDGIYHPIGLHAADRLGMEAEGLVAEYRKLLFLAGLIEYINVEEALA